MQPFVQEDRPAYVAFERRAVEDRSRSLSEGRYIAVDIDFAIITPAGSKDRIERRVDEWLSMLRQQVSEQRYPQEWLQHYSTSYDMWRSGQELPPTGSPLSQWGAISPAQLKNCLSINLRTIEDLANANEESLARLGMGGRDLQSRARTYLETAKNLGTTAEVINSLRQEVETRTKENTDLQERLARLEKILEQRDREVQAQSAKSGVTVTKG